MFTLCLLSSKWPLKISESSLKTRPHTHESQATQIEISSYSSSCVSLVFFSLAGGEKEAHWKRHCYHSIPGRGWRIVVLQTVYDPITLHPYPLRGWRLSEEWSGNQDEEVRLLNRYHISPTTLVWSCIINLSFTHLPDIFALVRYNSQNDSYRWVSWLKL